MKIESLHVGMEILHAQYGLGRVKTIGVHTVEILFQDGLKTVAPDVAEMEPAEAQVNVIGLSVSLRHFVGEIAREVIRELGIETSDAEVSGLGPRWQGGKIVLHPSNPSLQAKEIPLEIFFHKIVMLRNNLRVLEQKINSNESLGDAEKVELQQYITRSYGSLTTFNLLFKSKGDQFGGASAAG